MRNPFAVLKSAVSRFFTKPQPPAPVHVPKPEPSVIHAKTRAPLPEIFRKPEPVPDVYPRDPEAQRKARNARRKDRQECRAFVLKLHRGRA